MTIACTLTSAELRARRAQVAAIAERSLRSRRRIPRGARLVFESSAEPALRELVALEAECCPFLALDLRRVGDALELTITGPEEASTVIEALIGG
jgi:hypothetical protein